MARMWSAMTLIATSVFSDSWYEWPDRASILAIIPVNTSVS